jgi:hypothetical protein
MIRLRLTRLLLSVAAPFGHYTFRALHLSSIVPLPEAGLTETGPLRAQVLRKATLKVDALGVSMNGEGMLKEIVAG